MNINDFGRNSFVTHTTGLIERIKKAEKENQMRYFRGLTKKGKDFVYGWYFALDNRAYIIPLSDNFHTPASFICGFVEVIPETIGQQAGLKDKNGKDLDWWEDDIFARASDTRIEGMIIYDLGCFWFERKRGGRTPLYECVDWSMYKIGNVHQSGLMERENDTKNPR